MDNFRIDARNKRRNVLLRVVAILAIGLLAAGGGLLGHPDSSMRDVGRGLILAGYGIFGVELLTITGAAAHFWRKGSLLLPSSRKACPLISS